MSHLTRHSPRVRSCSCQPTGERVRASGKRRDLPRTCAHVEGALAFEAAKAYVPAVSPTNPPQQGLVSANGSVIDDWIDPSSVAASGRNGQRPKEKTTTRLLLGW
jgi:hypothetical protein